MSSRLYRDRFLCAFILKTNLKIKAKYIKMITLTGVYFKYIMKIVEKAI